MFSQTYPLKLQWREAEVADAFGGIAGGKELRRMDIDPRRKGRQGGKVVVNRGGREASVTQGGLPRQDIAAETGGDAVMAVAVHKERVKALQVERNLLGDGRGPDASDHEVKIAGAPGLQAIGSQPAQGRCVLPCSRLIEISTG